MENDNQLFFKFNFESLLKGHIGESTIATCCLTMLTLLAALLISLKFFFWQNQTNEFYITLKGNLPKPNTMPFSAIKLQYVTKYL